MYWQQLGRWVSTRLNPFLNKPVLAWVSSYQKSVAWSPQKSPDLKSTPHKNLRVLSQRVLASSSCSPQAGQRTISSSQVVSAIMAHLFLNYRTGSVKIRGGKKCGNSTAARRSFNLIRVAASLAFVHLLSRHRWAPGGLRIKYDAFSFIGSAVLFFLSNLSYLL